MRSASVLLLSAVISGCAAAPPTVSPPSAVPPAPVVTTVGTTEGSAPTASADQPVVVLDPGHNGRNGDNPAAINRQVPDGRGGTKACNTTGTQTDTGYPEHAFTFDVSQRVADRLTAAGVRVVSTRRDDDGIGPCVDERGRSGEQAGADAVVSIHADGAARTGHGFHHGARLPRRAVGPSANPAQEAPARALGVALRDAMRAGGFADSTYTAREGISPRRDLAGLNLSARPTALVECGNMRNPAEAALMTSADGRDRYAAAIASGVLAFLRR